MKLVTAEQMRSVDRETIENRGIPGAQLMENAGRGIAERIRDEILIQPQDKALAIFCGKGNNGGDGFVVGRYLHEYGAQVTIYYADPAEELSTDARLNYDRAVARGITIIPVKSGDELPERVNADYIVDAVFGTGFSGAPRGLPGEFIEWINRVEIRVIAVDCPSGLNVDTGQCEGAATAAEYTYTLGLPKIGQYYSPGRELCGIVEVVPIGVPEGVVESFDFKVNLITPELITSLLPERKPDGHKGDFGKLLILAGSTGLTGAATLAALASARTGLGLATVACPQTLNSILEAKLTEVMTLPLPDVGRKGILALRGLGVIRKQIGLSDAAIIGPGVGTHHETRKLIQRLLPSLDRPAVIDADGSNALAKSREVLTAEHIKIVLTPHPGEFRRLIDENLPEGISDLYDLIRQYSRKYNAVIVYKTSPTVVVDSDGQVYLNPTGNNGMATGGTGDVLSGMIGSFLAQGLNPLESALCGVYLHGLAGDLAAAELGCRAMIAGDLIDYISDAFRLAESQGERE
ncbi:MAG: NAD(P)H-hydrate dehydratase [Candidatus Zixiibacteriota bacterium]|nr:MAG: NAD(P)H-hydrate dehydratase [candidate division Zixibacteria bacterium]